VLYYAYIAVPVDTASYYLPDYVQEYMTWFAVSKYFDKMGKYAQANQYMSYFNKFLLFHRIDQSIKPIDSKDMMKTPDYTKVQ